MDPWARPCVLSKPPALLPDASDYVYSFGFRVTCSPGQAMPRLLPREPFFGGLHGPQTSRRPGGVGLPVEEGWRRIWSPPTPINRKQSTARVESSAELLDPSASPTPWARGAGRDWGTMPPRPPVPPPFPASFCARHLPRAPAHIYTAHAHIRASPAAWRHVPDAMHTGTHGVRCGARPCSIHPSRAGARDDLFGVRQRPSAL